MQLCSPYDVRQNQNRLYALLNQMRNKITRENVQKVFCEIEKENKHFYWVWHLLRMVRTVCWP